METYRYIYLGLDSERRLADLGFDVVDRSGELCNPVRLTPDGHKVASADPSVGKCIVSQTMSTALVEFADGTRATVSRRVLRLKEKLERRHV
jgi:hypothetical protein